MNTTILQSVMVSVHQQTASRRRMISYILFGAVLLVTMAASIMHGSVNISLSEIFTILRSGDTGGVNGFIIWKIRLPRAIAAALGGGYLAVAGLLLQVYFRNPIVGPFILGISHGATLTVSVVMLTSLSLGATSVNPYMATLAAFIGAYGAMTVVLSVASRVKNTVTLLIVGLMMGYLCHAVTSVLVAFAEKEKIKGVCPVAARQFFRIPVERDRDHDTGRGADLSFGLFPGQAVECLSHGRGVCPPLSGSISGCSGS